MHAGHSQKVLDRTKDQQFAENSRQPLGRAGRFADKPFALALNRARHEIIIEPALERCGIGHADLDARQHIVPRARCGEIDGRRDLADVAQHRFLALGNVRGEPQQRSGADGEDEIADPGHRQIGVMIFIFLEVAAGDRVVDAGCDIAMAQRHALGRAGRSGRMQQHGDVVGARAADQIGHQRRIGFNQGAPARDGRVERQTPLGFVRHEPAWIVIEDRRRSAGALAQFKQFVDLFLVFGDRDAWRAVTRVRRELIGRHVRKDGRWERAQRHGRKRRAIEARAVVADHRQRLAGAKAERFQRRRQRHHLGERLRPVSLLPHPAVALAKRGAAAGFRRITRQRRDQGGGTALFRDRPGRHQGRAQRHIHDTASARRAAAR